MNRIQRMSRCAILVSLALTLSWTERLFPLQLLVPLPGVKLGLANIVTLIALYLMGAGEAFIILILRCLLGAMFAGSTVSLLFSLSGGLMAMAAMAAVRHVRGLSVYGVSVLGAAAHSFGQILAAVLLMHSVCIWAYLSYLLLVSLFTGMATGCMSAGVLRALCALEKRA